MQKPCSADWTTCTDHSIFPETCTCISLENISSTIEGSLLSEYLEQMTHPGSANDLSKVDVHPVVTAYKMSIVRFTIFQFYQLGKKRKHL